MPPSAPAEPVNPMSPLEPVKPILPVKPMSPFDPVNPISPLDPVYPRKLAGEPIHSPLELITPPTPFIVNPLVTIFALGLIEN